MAQVGSQQTGLGSVPTAGEGNGGGGGGGGGAVDSVTGVTVDNTDPANPVVNAPALTNTTPAPVGPAAVGIAITAARGDHQHATPVAANLAALAALSAASMNAGTFCYVTTLKSWFKLEPSTQAAAAAVRVAASGKAGHLWIRESIQPAWWSVLAWFVGPSATADPEADGATALTPIPPQEWFRRTFCRWLPGTETASVTMTLTANLGDNDFVQAHWGIGLRGGGVTLSVNGSQTAIAGSSGVISASTALNRATNTPNSVTAGFSFAALVGKFIRLQGSTTTTAHVMKDLGANTGRLSEQNVNLVVGTGFTNGQTIEAYNPTKVPGAHIDGPSQVIFTDCDFDPTIATQIRCTGATTNCAAIRCRFRSPSASSITALTLSLTACVFADRAWNMTGNPNPITLCTFVNMATTGLGILKGLAAENAFQSCVSQASTVTIAEGTYAHVSGGGSGTFGFFDLGAAQKGFDLFNAAKLSCSGLWGSGNNASAVIVNIPVSAQWSVPSFANIATIMSIAGGVGARTATASAALDVPLAQMPHAFGPAPQPAMQMKFSGALNTDAGGVTFAYLADPGSAAAAAAANLAAQRYPSSERLIMRLRVTKLTGAGVTTNNITATLYINGVATLMKVTINAADAAGTKYVDSLHPLCLRDGDDYDLRLDDAADVLGGTLEVSAALECAA